MDETCNASAGPIRVGGWWVEWIQHRTTWKTRGQKSSRGPMFRHSKFIGTMVDLFYGTSPCRKGKNIFFVRGCLHTRIRSQGAEVWAGGPVFPRRAAPRSSLFGCRARKRPWKKHTVDLRNARLPSELLILKPTVCPELYIKYSTVGSTGMGAVAMNSIAWRPQNC